MKYKLSDLPKVNLPAILYSVQPFKVEITDTDIYSIENYLKRAVKKDSNISWFVAVSDTDSETSFKYSEKTKKRGRPKIKVAGEKINKHTHIGIIGSKEKSAYSVATGLKELINKRKGIRCSIVVSMKGAGYITYSYNQANSFHTGGEFDFSPCYTDFYIEE